MRVKKRDGNYEVFDISKISRGISAAFMNRPKIEEIPDTTPIAHAVVRRLTGKGLELNTEQIENAVEKELMFSGYDSVAKAFILYRANRFTAIKPDQKLLMDYIHYSKYAKRIGHRREGYDETVQRTVDMMVRRFPDLEDEIVDAYQGVFDSKLTGSMRCMQFGGEAIEAENLRMFNCSFTNVNRPRVFSEIFYVLLCGAGVGYSVKWRHVKQLGKLNTISKEVNHHTIGDSIEGWAVAIDTLINSYFGDDNRLVEFDYSKIRPAGTTLKTSGGIAPGHIDLRIAIENIRKILDSSKELRSVQCHDIICWLAWCVVSGGIRRASLLSLFDPEDTEMLYCKSVGQFEPGKLNDQRQMANNSAHFVQTSIDADPARWKSIFDRVMNVSLSNYGCPGVYFSESADVGCNPCGEIGLDPGNGFAFCNLCDIIISKIKSEDEFLKVCQMASIIGTLQASFTDFGYLLQESIDNAKRDALLGISLTGMMDNIPLAFDPKVLQSGVKIINETNIIWAQKLGINPARSTTCIKPSGTASLKFGCSAGIHPRHAKRYFRRVIAGADEPMALYVKEINPHMVLPRPDGKICLEFPIQAPGMVIEDLPTMTHISMIEKIYENWIKPGTVRGDLQNNVSCTVVVKDVDMKKLIDYIWDSGITAMSFVPNTVDTLFAFAPNKAVKTRWDEERWNNLIQLMRPIDWSKYVEKGIDNVNRTMEPACAGGSCEL